MEPLLVRNVLLHSDLRAYRSLSCRGAGTKALNDFARRNIDAPYGRKLLEKILFVP